MALNLAMNFALFFAKNVEKERLASSSLPRFLQVRRQKLKNLRQLFVVINKCAIFHGDSPSGEKVKFNLPSTIELSEMADFVYNFV